MTRIYREHSKARGAARTVGFVLASYADKWGNGIWVSLDRLMREANVNRKSAVDGRHWHLKNGEAELTDRPDGEPLMKGRVRVMSMAPLRERAEAAKADLEGSESELLFQGSESEPQQEDGSVGEPSGVRSDRPGVRSAPPSGSVGAPETGRDQLETGDETGDARAGARALSPSPSSENHRYPDGETDSARVAAQRRHNASVPTDPIISGLSPSSTGSAGPTPAQIEAERAEKVAELAACDRTLAEGRGGAMTKAAAAELRQELGIEVAA